jgi:hypothetical protein
MPTIDELSEPYANFLLPILPTGPGVCSICHTSVIGTYARCIPCNSAKSVLPSLADSIGFVSLAVKGQQLAYELAFYKDERYSFEKRLRTIAGLTAVLWRWLKLHEECVARSAGVPSFSVITSVPSTRQREDHPLSTMVREKIGVTIDRYRPLLSANPEFSDNRDFSHQRFIVQGNIQPGTSVLIIDDTFTKGSRVQSASAALKEAGASTVGVVCIGRHFAHTQDGAFGVAAKTYLKRSTELTWSWERCCYCDNIAPS